MGAPSLVDGHLPMGRWVCTLGEAEASYVPADPANRRRELWDQWMSLTAALRSVVGELPACWLSGSFFSDKPVPGDIDCLYVIDTDRLADVVASGDGGRIAFLQAVTTNQVKSIFGLHVDSFVLEWMPTPGPTPAVGTERYLSSRGYWDDLWVRVKDSNHRLDSVPRRGYLEVIVDGYR